MSFTQRSEAKSVGSWGTPVSEQDLGFVIRKEDTTVFQKNEYKGIQIDWYEHNLSGMLTLKHKNKKKKIFRKTLTSVSTANLPLQDLGLIK